MFIRFGFFSRNCFINYNPGIKGNDLSRADQQRIDIDLLYLRIIGY